MGPDERDAVRASILELTGAGEKGVSLACEMAARHRCSGDDLLAAIEEMVLDGDLVEVEYVTPANGRDDPARAKSFFLPAGTAVRVRAPGRAEA